MSLSSLGLTPFRIALGIEIAANIASIHSMVIDPDRFLTTILTSMATASPIARTLIQMLGGLGVGFTLPLFLSWPNPTSGPAGDIQRSIRRLTYYTMGACEVCLGTVMLGVYLKGEHGVDEKSLLTALGLQVVLVSVRALFLILKPEWLEGRDESGKKMQ